MLKQLKNEYEIKRRESTVSLVQEDTTTEAIVAKVAVTKVNFPMPCSASTPKHAFKGVVNAKEIIASKKNMKPDSTNDHTEEKGFHMELKKRRGSETAKQEIHYFEKPLNLLHGNPAVGKVHENEATKNYITQAVGDISSPTDFTTGSITNKEKESFEVCSNTTPQQKVIRCSNKPSSQALSPVDTPAKIRILLPMSPKQASAPNSAKTKFAGVIEATKATIQRKLEKNKGKSSKPKPKPHSPI